MIEVRDAQIPDEIPHVRALFEQYAAALGIDLCFQGFAAELDGLPGAYARPGGRLLLARVDDQIAGCVALRPLVAACCSVGVSKLLVDNPESAEMKRLYVSAQFRDRGVGRALTEHALAEASAAGYQRVCLDTLPVMNEAIKLYQSLGFTQVASYYENPVPGTLFFTRAIPTVTSSPQMPRREPL